MTSNPMANMAKGAMLGIAAGLALGIAGKNAVDHNPKLKKKANKAIHTMDSMLDTARYMFK